MDRVAVSKFLNRLTGGDDGLLCARVYRNHRDIGAHWTLFKNFLDWAFAWQEDQHCRRCWLHEYKEKRRDR